MPTRTLAAFSLLDMNGEPRSYPTGRHALLCFVKEDCPTCLLSLPLLEAAQRAFGRDIDVWAVGQDADGNAGLGRRFPAIQPLLDDSALRVSHAFELDTVPTVIVADGAGKELRRFVGFGRTDWHELFEDLARLSGVPVPAIDWAAYSESRPGCGSRSVEPGIAERLAAEAAGSPIRARRIEIGGEDDPFEFMFDQGLTDGLPVVPPTAERVLRMLAGTRRDPQEAVAVMPPNMAPLTVEKIAINAVMAGCKPEYLTVVIAAVEAICAEQFNIHGLLATMWFAGPVLLVNGPVRNRIGMNCRLNALGQGNRANATIGRAVQLVVRNIGGGRPGEVDRATLGQPGKFTMCFPEYEEYSHWEPFHVERGFRPNESTVTVFAGCAPFGFLDQVSRDPRSLAVSYALALLVVTHPKVVGMSEIVVVVTPEHVETFARAGWTKDELRHEIHEATLRPVSELVQDARCEEGMPPRALRKLAPDALLPKFKSPEAIKLVVAGGEAGKFGAFFPPWMTGETGSIMTTRLIGE